jgi:hypothetical protein
MEMSQGNFLYATLNKQKCLSFFFYKIVEQEGRTGLISGAGTSKRWQEVGKWCRWVYIVQILGTHVCKWKNETC